MCYCTNLKDFADFLLPIFLPNMMCIVDWRISIMEDETVSKTVSDVLSLLTGPFLELQSRIHVWIFNCIIHTYNQ